VDRTYHLLHVFSIILMVGVVVVIGFALLGYCSLQWACEGVGCPRGGLYATFISLFIRHGWCILR